jgi:tetratricopeptide (TPR) repeat protein
MAPAPTRLETGSIEAGLANGARLLARSPAEAALQARALLTAEPHNTAAHRLFARAMAALGNAEEARLARARAVQFSREVRPIVAAHKAVQAGKPDEADRLLRAYLARYPDDPVALRVLGEARAQMGDRTGAVHDLETALAFMPEYVDARIALVRVHQQFFDQVAALAALEPLLDERPDETMLLRWKASLLSNLDEHEAAAEILQRLVDAHQQAELWIALGDELRTLGRREAAHAAYREAVQRAPQSGNAWWGIAALGHTPFDRDDRDRIASALARVPPGDPGRVHLHFALGVAYELAGDFGGAFAQFAAGNALRLKAEPFDPAAVAAHVQHARRALSPEIFAARGDAGCPAPDPIFVIGMPRSGSTLVEQILAGHSEVEGTAELPIVPVLARTFLARFGLRPGASYLDLLPKVPPNEFAAIGEEYLRLARPHRKTGKRHFVDKLPHNWADVGFIRLALPNAKIIDVRRAPMDCCWSNFRMLFARGHPSSNSLEGMAAFYRHYVAMMEHIDVVLPNPVYRVIYERLVDDFEPEVRRLTEWLGLPFEREMLEFHDHRRPVATASAEQVRQPLNRSGIGAWRAYEEWLDPLVDAVGDLERTYAG